MMMRDVESFGHRSPVLKMDLKLFSKIFLAVNNNKKKIQRGEIVTSEVECFDRIKISRNCQTGKKLN